MMGPAEIGDLIFKYLRDELTAPEKKILQDWRDESVDNELMFLSQTDPDNIISDLKDYYKHKDAVWDRILEKAPELAVPPARKFPLLSMVAAAAVLFLIAGTGIYIFSKQKKALPAFVVSKPVTAPGGSHAVLQLTNGSAILLDSVHTGSVAVQGNSTVIKEDSNGLVYNGNGQPKISGLVFNTLITPRGGEYKIVLSDGTKVWMNAASSLKYPVYFAGNDRKVELTGEAYFEVAKDASKPFRVIVNNRTTVEVLGTHFNIMAYDDEPYLNTTLLEGSVKIDKSVLSPGQQARINSYGEINILNDVDTAETVAWKNGRISFDNADIRTIMRAVSRWYDVDVSYEGDIPGVQYMGGIRRDTELPDLLKVLALNKIHFKTTGKKITVSP
jgi:transmembrane sensor